MKVHRSGLIYTQGSIRSNYRLLTADARWCVRWIGQLRGLGLPLAEICDLGRDRPHDDTELIGARLADRLRAARTRPDSRIADLERIRSRIDEFEASHHAQLTGRPSARAPTA